MIELNTKHQLNTNIHIESRHVIYNNVAFDKRRLLLNYNIHATNTSSDQATRMRVLIWSFADRTYHMVEI